MSQPGFLARLLPLRLRKSVPVVAAVRLSGAIGIGSPLKPPLTAKDVTPLLEKAFSRKGIKAVALIINSPGGSAVQSALIHARVRELAAEHTLPVYAFCEDVAASGGYWLACAGDEIYADESSIIGSIGVIAAGFGFTEAIAKLGIERRIHTVGESKSMLDPFVPEKPEDVARLKSLQSDIHESFKALVRARRAGKLKGTEAELFTGEFWTGKGALQRGLIDGIGHLNPVLKAKFGDKLVIKTITPSQGWGLRRLGFGNASGAEMASALVSELETRAMWWRFGL